MANELEVNIPITCLIKDKYKDKKYDLPVGPLSYLYRNGIHVHSCIGDGYFSAAYEGRYTEKAKLPTGCEKYLGKEFAVKIHHIGYHPYIPGAPNKEKIDRQTLNEIHFSKRTDIVHPNLIRFHFTFEYPEKSTTVCDHVFMFMEKAMFPLQDLINCLIRLRATVPVSVGLRWMRDLYSGLIHLHSLGIAHNDLHSYNVFVFGDCGQQIGSDFRYTNIVLKIADYGESVDTSKFKPKEAERLYEFDLEDLCSRCFIPLCQVIAFNERDRNMLVDSLQDTIDHGHPFQNILNKMMTIKNAENEKELSLRTRKSLEDCLDSNTSNRP